jgi:hypothetical protein
MHTLPLLLLFACVSTAAAVCICAPAAVSNMLLLLLLLLLRNVAIPLLRLAYTLFCFFNVLKLHVCMLPVPCSSSGAGHFILLIVFKHASIVLYFIVMFSTPPMF